MDYGQNRVAITTPKRALLAEIERMNAGLGLRNAIQLPGYLRSEVVLGQQNEITFRTGTNEPNNGGAGIFATENRLDINDAFFVTHYGLYFYKFTTAAGNAARSRARLHSFPNATVFGANAPELEGAYNGKLSLRVDDTVFIDSMDVRRFYNARTAQQGVAVSTAASNNAYTADDWSGAEMFANETDPLVRLNGPGKNVIRVALPDTMNFGLVPTETIVAVCYLRGWLSQNGGGFRATGR